MTEAIMRPIGSRSTQCPATDTQSYARINGRLMVTDDREMRLPQWAQRLINDLRTTVIRLETERDAARFETNPDESDTLIDFYHDPPVGLGMGTKVRFLLPPSRLSIPDYIDVRTSDGGVLIAANVDLLLRPQASNVFHASAGP